ncbi:MAG: RHS repeat-associated core domain-containing protein [Armatimonadota bacterium]|nr:RHS repeat-associated core domain-containing protein [Armatimonadota bacterium]
MSVDYTYDPAGKPEKEMYGNNTFAEYTYNNALQLSALKHWKSGSPNVLLVTSDYLRDKVGNPTDMSWDSGSTTTSCVYDNISRLWKVTYPGQSQTVFGYDWVGNRNDQDWQTNAVDELSASPSNTYDYDPFYGNLVTRNYNDVDTTFEYDNYNLLKKINWPNGNGMNQFLSDAAGNRIRMIGSDGAPTWHFIYDTTAGIPAVLAETVSNGSSKLYIRTPDGRLIAQAHVVSGSPVLDHYYHFDALGSTKALTNSSGTVTDTYSYDVWGNVTHDSGTTQQPYLFVGQLGYYTHYQDPMLSPFSANSDKYVLLQLGVRYYAPEIGRFTQRDPVVTQGSASYSYVGDAPVSRIDPQGLVEWDTRDFWTWYTWLGHGRAVDLADVGLLDDFKNAASVKQAVQSFHSQVYLAMKDLARTSCSGGAAGGVLSGRWFLQNTTGTDVTWEPKLFAIGKSTFFRKASCRYTIDCCARTLQYSCRFTYWIRDVFEDPFRIAESLGVPVEIGDIYRINAKWHWNFRSPVMMF